MVDQPLQVLIVEDSENDAALLEIELQRAGYAPTCWRVDNRQAMEAALERQSWDLVIADYVMPRFNGLGALALVKEKGLDLPFIIVSGHITDDTAVAAMKAGAHDYVMKDNLARLGPAVQRELREAEERRQRRRADEKLRLEQVFREAIENSIPSGIAAVDLAGRQSYVNPAFCAMVGWSAAELVGARAPFAYWPPEDIPALTQAFEQMRQGHAPPGGLELRFRRRAGEIFYVLLQLTPLRDSSGQVTGWVSSASDITARKRAEIRLAAEHAITRILATALSLGEAAPAILQALLNSLEVEGGLLWTVDSQQGRLQLASQEFRPPGAGLQALLEANRQWAFAAGEGLPGRVWQERQALWLADLEQVPEFARRELVLQAGLRSALVFPVQSGTDFFGVLELFARRHWEQDQAQLNMLTAISSEMGQFVQRRQAEEALRRAHDELEVRVQQRTAELAAALQELQASVSERKRLEQELLEITEKERRRIGLDLHDDLGQKLSGIALMTKGLEIRLSKVQAEAAQDAGKIHELIQEAMTHASDLAQDLATLDLAEKDLPTALGNLAAHAQELFQITCRFKAAGEMPPLEANTVTQLYKITQEAVTNAIKHGKAKRVVINLARDGDRLVLSIQNNGLPFPDLRSESTGMGLRIMNYRASLLRADLSIKGTGTRGTLVSCSVPLTRQT